jgi:hypothetical protein
MIRDKAEGSLSVYAASTAQGGACEAFYSWLASPAALHKVVK